MFHYHQNGFIYNDTSTVSLVIFYFFIHACNKIIDSQYAKHYFLNIL